MGPVDRLCYQTPSIGLIIEYVNSATRGNSGRIIVLLGHFGTLSKVLSHSAVKSPIHRFKTLRASYDNRN